KRGEVPRSTDLNNAAAYCGLLLAGASLGVFSFEQVANVLIVLLGQADKLAPVFFQHGTIALSGGLLGATAEATWSWFIGPMVLVLLSVIIQRSLVFAPSKLQPKLSRISILSNAKNKFGRTGLFEFLKSTVKLTVICYSIFLSMGPNRRDYSFVIAFTRCYFWAVPSPGHGVPCCGCVCFVGYWFD
ncbi:MAG: EscU/YscU/HrcU family type III secretion system export apparatus switch protein, partial [Pseudomonadota bacterium]